MSRPTYFAALRWAAKQVTETPVDPDAPRFMLLMKHDWDLTALLSHQRDEMPEDEWAWFQRAIRRVLNNEPPQYVVGLAPFYGRTFQVNSDVLVPESETEELVEWVLQTQPAKKDLKVLDLGTGSGVIGITLALERPTWQVTLSDVSAAALKIAARNQERLGTHLPQLQSDLFSQLVEQKFDLIVTNPPYVATTARPAMDAAVVEFEPALALFAGSDGLDFYRRLFDQLPVHLREGGRLYGETGYDQEQSIQHLAKQLLPGWSVTTKHDMADRMRMIRICGGLEKRGD
ncbi:peptide chain release factor N(5)-glutamine methyltransferase [Limosilactobacillus difficilis]|uniref:peptide chain release factor N(5)-glutamine methyltransferase n=1 Tax=Limosilactobacillus difficilis TaxID=2991838 RepID=UPI0024B98709|nr:peptide chain release factor N(5)-glutamine methyltransferase [Limosilactobacillus difficilis]